MNISGMINHGRFFWQKHAPEVLVWGGVIGTVGGAVMACFATRKLDGVLAQHRDSAEEVHKQFENSTDESAEKRELTKVYLKTGLNMVKLYGPSVTIELLSVTGILSGNNMLRKQNIALAAAYTALDAGFRQYRGRVVERYGEDTDLELRHGLHKEKIEETVTDEKGKQQKVKKTVTVAGDGELSDYARYFAYGEAKGAEQNADYNEFFLRSQQELANHMLRANGFLFLNEVYDMLGIDRSIPGQAVGWVYDKHSEEHGDNWVDFGIQEVYRKKSDEPGDYEKVFLLNFNVDGSIINHSFNKGLITA